MKESRVGGDCFISFQFLLVQLKKDFGCWAKLYLDRFVNEHIGEYGTDDRQSASCFSPTKWEFVKRIYRHISRKPIRMLRLRKDVLYELDNRELPVN